MPFLDHDEIVCYFHDCKFKHLCMFLISQLAGFQENGMRFERFTQLTIMQKKEKLIRAFQKISTRAQRDKTIYKSLNNFFRIQEIYADMLQVMYDLHTFVTNLPNNEDI